MFKKEDIRIIATIAAISILLIIMGTLQMFHIIT